MFRWRDNRCWVLLLLGFFAGLPAALIAGTLQAWFTDAGLNLRLIGGLTLLLLPYSLRFLWSPLFDEIRLSRLGRRRSWMLVIQSLLILFILIMGLLSPTDRFAGIPWLIVPGLMVSVLAASQEMVINAWQTEIFSVNERGFSAGVYVAGWRVGSIVSGGLALVMAAHIGWHQTYFLMAALMAFAPLVTLLAPREINNRLPKTHSFARILYLSITTFFRQRGTQAALILLLLIMTFKLGDALALALNTTFLLRKIGFSLETVGYVNKTVSFIAAILGGLVGGLWMRYLSLYRALILFAVIQAFSHVGYILLIFLGRDFNGLIVAAFLENFCSGMGTIALLALIMDLCKIEYTATQLALFNALAYIPRVIVGPMAAYFVYQLGWVNFFGICIVASLLPVILVHLIKDTISLRFIEGHTR